MEATPDTAVVDTMPLRTAESGRTPTLPAVMGIAATPRQPYRSARDLADLRGSGLSDDTIRGACIFTCTNSESIGARLCWEGSADALGECLVFPIRGRSGEFGPDCVLKPSRPRVDGRGKITKYEFAVGRGLRLYFTPTAIAALNKPCETIVFVEGIKKALAAAQSGIPAIAVMGCWAWCKTDDTGKRALIPDFAELLPELKGRRIVLVPDSDAVENDSVQRGFTELAIALESAGVMEVVQVDLPPLEDGSKSGLDDYLLTDPNLSGWQTLLRAARRPPLPDSPGVLSNVVCRPPLDGVEQEPTPRHPSHILRRLLHVCGGEPFRVGGRLIVTGPDYRPLVLKDHHALIAFYQQRAGERFGTSGGSSVRWKDRAEGVTTKAELFAYVLQNAQTYDAIELFPHHEPLPNINYMHPPLPTGDGMAIKSLINRFSPATDDDRELLLAYFVTHLWGGPPGSRPAFLFEAEDDTAAAGRGAGKSTPCQILCHLLENRFVAVKDDEDYNRIKTRLLSDGADGARVLVMDNLKSLRLSDQDLEAMITSPVIDGHRLYSGQGRRPNLLTVTITVNGAMLSKDMAQRVVPIRVKRAAYSGDWLAETMKFVDENRWKIIADLLAFFRLRTPVTLRKFSRWGAWEADVLSRLRNPERIQALIAARQADADTDADDAELVREAVEAMLVRCKHVPSDSVVNIPSIRLGPVVAKALGRSDGNAALKYLKSLAVPCLTPERDKNRRFWRWAGPDSNMHGSRIPAELGPEPLPRFIDARGLESFG